MTGVSLAVGSDGNVYGWGRNSVGQLGIGTQEDSLVPVEAHLPAGARAVGVSENFEHSLALTTTGGDGGNVQFLAASPPLETLAGARYNAIFRASG